MRWSDLCILVRTEAKPTPSPFLQFLCRVSTDPELLAWTFTNGDRHCKLWACCAIPGKRFGQIGRRWGFATAQSRGDPLCLPEPWCPPGCGDVFWINTYARNAKLRNPRRDGRKRTRGRLRLSPSPDVREGRWKVLSQDRQCPLLLFAGSEFSKSRRATPRAIPRLRREAGRHPRSPPGPAGRELGHEPGAGLLLQRHFAISVPNRAKGTKKPFGTIHEIVTRISGRANALVGRPSSIVTILRPKWRKLGLVCRVDEAGFSWRFSGSHAGRRKLDCQ